MLSPVLSGSPSPDLSSRSIHGGSQKALLDEEEIQSLHDKLLMCENSDHDEKKTGAKTVDRSRHFFNRLQPWVRLVYASNAASCWNV